MQPQIGLDADPIVITVGMPAQRQQVLPGTDEKLLLAQGDMVFTPGIGRAGNIAVRDQQLRMFPLP